MSWAVHCVTSTNLGQYTVTFSVWAVHCVEITVWCCYCLGAVHCNNSAYGPCLL